MEFQENNKVTRSSGKRFSTLIVGGLVLVATASVLVGKFLLSNVEAKAGKQIQTVASSEAKDSVNTQAVTESQDVKTTATEDALPGDSQKVEVQSEIKDGVQYITSSVDQSSYEPITVQQGIPVKWTINVPEGVLNSCNNAIIIPKYDQEVELKAGENVIEFTPEESGVFPFSCWMGMIQSDITVVSEDGTVDQNADDGTSGYTGSGRMSGGCGMGNGQGATGGCCGF